MTLLAVVFAWFGSEARDAAARRRFMSFIDRHGMHVYSVYEMTEDGISVKYGEPRVDMDRTRLGHLFSDTAYDPVRILDLTTRRYNREADWDWDFRQQARYMPIIRYQGLMHSQAQSVLEEVEQFPCAKEVHIVIASGSDLNDETIALLEQFPELKHVDLVRTDVTDAGLRKLTRHKNLLSFLVEPDVLSEETARDLFISMPSLQSIILPSLPQDLFNYMRGPEDFEILRRDMFVEDE